MNIYNWLIKIVGVLGALGGIFLLGRRDGKKDAEMDTLEALREAETEASQTLSKRQADEQKAIEDAHNRTTRRDFD